MPFETFLSFYNLQIGKGESLWYLSQYAKSNDVENRVGFGKRQAECNPGSASAGCVIMGKPPNLSETKCPHFYHLSIIVGISVLLRIKWGNIHNPTKT